jgi:hypothetical protein
MLTIFSCPKPFTNPHINIIQRNAIKSWTLLQPRPEIILIGDEKGVAEICKEFGLRHIPEVERNEFGTPLVNSIFSKAESVASNNIMCYVNADIILMSDFLLAIQKVLKYKPQCLIIGRRWDIDINVLLDFSEECITKLKSYVYHNGKLHAHTGIDFFIFPKGIFGEILPFALGRTMWDNWLIYIARSKKIPVIDITHSVIVIHQNHDYSHYPGGVVGILNSNEAKRNLSLAGGYLYAFTVLDATHKLIKGKRIKINIASMPCFYYYLVKISIRYPFFTPFVKLARGIREYIAFTLNNFYNKIHRIVLYFKSNKK